MDNLKKYSLVIVHWVDSMSTRGWYSEQENEEKFKEVVSMISVGFLFKKDKNKIALVGSKDTQNPPMLNHYHEIPIRAVISIKRLK